MPLNETDIEIAQLKPFREASTATVFLDLHGLITSVDEQGSRYKKQWEQPGEWLKAIDTLKMNEKEAAWWQDARLRTLPVTWLCRCYGKKGLASLLDYFWRSILADCLATGEENN